jgi:hypothetical protein
VAETSASITSEAADNPDPERKHKDVNRILIEEFGFSPDSTPGTTPAKPSQSDDEDAAAATAPVSMTMGANDDTDYSAAATAKIDNKNNNGIMQRLIDEFGFSPLNTPTHDKSDRAVSQSNADESMEQLGKRFGLLKLDPQDRGIRSESEDELENYLSRLSIHNNAPQKGACPRPYILPVIV